MARPDKNLERSGNRPSKRRSGRRRRKELARKMRGPVQAIWAAILLPVKILFLPAQLIDVFYFRGHKTSKRTNRSRSIRRRAKSWWREALAFPYRVVSTATHRSRRGELVYLLPAFLTFAFISYVSFQLSVHNQQIQSRYNNGARNALLRGDITLANTYFGRLFERSSLSDTQRMHWVAVLRSAGEMDRAERLLDDLAPKTGGGYPPAHAVRAIELAAELDFGPNESDGDGQLNSGLSNHVSAKSKQLGVDGRVEALRMHLRFADEDDPRVQLAWAKYWFCRQDIVAACQHLSQAKQSPEMFLEVAQTANQRMAVGRLSGNEMDLLKNVAQESLEEAQDQFDEQVNADPLNHGARIHLAAALVNQSKFKLAKQTLQAGIDFQADPTLRRGLAEVYVLEYTNRDQAGASETKTLSRAELESRINQLKSAIAADHKYLLPYVCLARLLSKNSRQHVASSTSIEDATADECLAIQTFRWLVTSDQPTAVDHLGLATLHWHGGDVENAESHLEQAWAIQSDFEHQAHRFAAAYAFFSEGADLGWARKIVDESLRRSPGDPEILLSQGRILLEQGEVESAVEQLLRAVEGAELPEEVHVALEAGYSRMGNLELAAQHGRLAKAAKTHRTINRSK